MCELAAIFDKGTLGLARETALLKEGVGILAGAIAQEHELGACVFDGDLLHVGEQTAPDSAATSGLGDHDVFDHSEGLAAVHRVGTNRQERRSANRTVDFRHEEDARRRPRKCGDLVRGHTEHGIGDQFAIETFDR
jgi:hypothetical protein